MIAESCLTTRAERTFHRSEAGPAASRVMSGLGWLLLPALAFWPVLRWYGLRLNDGSDEPWGLIALGAAVWFIRENRARGAIIRWEGGRLAAMSGILLAYAMLFPLLPAMVRALLAIAILAIALDLPRRAPAALGLLVLSLPVLATAQFYLGWPLRLTAAAGTGGLLNLAGFEVVREGAVIWWQGSPVSVDPPCSGIRMLWAGLFLHFVLAAKNRLGFGTLLWLTPLAVIAIVAGNIARAFLLFFKESGTIALPEWMHAGIGMAVFAVLAIGMARWYSRLPSCRSKPVPVAWKGTGNRRVLLVIAAVLAGMAPFFEEENRSATAPASAETFPGWPVEWEGEPLIEIPLGDQEKAFARAFPGRLGVFETGDGKRVILRWVTAPTRKLHSSADCLRAGGFAVKNEAGGAAAGENWKHFHASHPDWGNFELREKVRSAANPARSWPEVSAWFWAASFQRDSGPWWAITVMEPRES